MSEPTKEHVTPHQERIPMPIAVRTSLAMVVLAAASYITGVYLHGYEYGYMPFADPVMLGLVGVAIVLACYYFIAIYKNHAGVRESVLTVALIFLAMDLHSFYMDGLDYSLIADLVGTTAIWTALLCLCLPSSTAWRKAERPTN